MAERTLTVKILGDATQAQRVLQGFQSHADATASRMSQLGDRFTDAGKKATMFVTLPIVGALGAATKAAADEGKEMAVLANTLRATTGATETQVGAVERYITATQNATGITDGELRPALGRLLMSTKDTGKAQELLAVAMDVSVARGISLETAATALGKAYSGNTAGLGRLGVATKDASGEALSFDQIMANLSKTVGGSAAAAADTAAGRAAILRAKFSDMTEDIGNKLVPVLEKVTGTLGRVVDAFGALPESSQQFIIMGALAAAAVGPITSLVGMALKLADGLKSAATAGTGANTALKGLAVAGGVLGGVLLLKQGLDALGLSARGVEIDLGGVASATDRELVSAFNKVGKIGAQQEVFNKILAESPTQAQRLVDALKATGQETDKYQASIDKTIVSEKAAIASRQADTEMVQGAIVPTGELTEEVEEQESAYDRVKEAVDSFTTSLNQSLGVTLTSNEAQRQHREKVEALSAAIQTNGTQVGFATEKQRALGAAVDAAVESAQREVEALTQDGLIAADNASQKASLILRLEELKQKYPQLAGAIDAHIAKVRSIPDSVTTTANLDVSKAEAELRRWAGLVASLQKSFGGSLTSGLALPQFHSGGMFHAPTPGGEGLAILKDREVVLSPGQSAAAGSSGTATYVSNNYFTIEGSVISDRDLIDKVATGLEERRRRNGPGNY